MARNHPPTAARRKAGRVRKQRPARTRASWRRVLVLDGIAVLAGLLCGIFVAGGLAWRSAVEDVEAWRSDPPQPPSSIVYSAPMELSVGTQVDRAALESDLLAAGYERAEELIEPAPGAVGSFRVTDEGVELWSSPWSGPTGDTPGGRATVRIADQRITATTPSLVVLRPTVLGTIGDPELSRAGVKLAHLSPFVEPALLAMEDSRFRTHHGLDPLGVLRALVATGRGDTQGGSTLTQQLAKNLFLTSDRTLRRKVREVFLAAALESRFTKDELLEMYLSEVYLGQMGGLPIYGVEAAARAWFGTSAQRLALHEAATIVGVIPAPNTWSPVRHPEAALERRAVVLQRMRELDRITGEQRAAADAAPLGLRGLAPSRIRLAPYAVDAAVERAEAALGEGALAQQGVRVYTAIQPLLQRAAERAAKEGMASLDAEYPKAAGAEVAVVSVRTADGAVVAMVGGRDYASSPFNRADDARRLAGSTVKPLTLLEAFDMGELTPATMLADEPISRSVDDKTWTPSNDDGQYLGAVTVRAAIEGSRNIPAIHVAEHVGAQRLQRHLRDAGLAEATNLPSAALGAFPTSPLELAGAYTAFANGKAWRPRLVLAIEDAGGQTILDQHPEAVRLSTPQAAAQVERLLEGVITSGTGARAARFGVGPPAAGKTGTTDGFRDAWFAGLTPSLTTVVWVGRDEGMLGLSGSRAALPTWARFVAASGAARGRYTRPEGLVDASICAETGLVAREGCPEVTGDLFVRGTAPDRPCDVHGSPAVQAGRLLGGLFRRQRSEEPVGADGAAEATGR